MSGEPSVQPDSAQRVRFGGDDDRPRIYSVTHDILGDPFWAVYRNGLKDGADRFRCRVDHAAPETFSPPAMVGLLASAIDEKPDGLLATVPDYRVVEGELQRAIALGIPLIAVNAADPRDAPARIPYIHYIGANDRLAGAEVARRQLVAGAPAQAVCFDHYLQDNVCHQARCGGYLDVMREAGIPADRVRVPGDDPVRCLADTRAALGRAARPVAVCTLGPPGSAAVTGAIDADDLRDSVRHASFDLAPAQLDAIRGGSLDFSVDSQQYLQAFLSVAMLHLKATKGFELAGDVLTGPVFVDRINCERVEEGIASGFR